MASESMNCKVFRQNVDSYIDGELDKIRSQQIILHMEECEECRRIFEQRIEMCASFGALPDPPSDFTESWKAAIKKDSAKRNYNRKIWRVGGAAAAAVVVSVALWNSYARLASLGNKEGATIDLFSQDNSDEQTGEALSPRRSDLFKFAIAPSMWNDVPSARVSQNAISMIIDMRDNSSEVISFVDCALGEYADNYIVKEDIAYVRIDKDKVDSLVSKLRDNGYILAAKYDEGENHEDVVIRILG